MPDHTSMPVFILFDTKTGYLYGHVFATGPQDPFLQEVVAWWSTHCSTLPIGVDHPDVVVPPITANRTSN